MNQQLPIKNNPLLRRQHDVFIGIDTGVNTGIAIWRRKDKYFEVATVKIHQAIYIVNVWWKSPGVQLYVIVEDPRKIGGGGDNKHNVARAQGAGSVKRDAKIWEDFLTDKGIHFEMKRPTPSGQKWNSDKFMRLTGYERSTDEHGRDAGILVYGL